MKLIQLNYQHPQWAQLKRPIYRSITNEQIAAWRAETIAAMEHNVRVFNEANKRHTEMRNAAAQFYKHAGGIVAAFDNAGFGQPPDYMAQLGDLIKKVNRAREKAAQEAEEQRQREEQAERRRVRRAQLAAERAEAEAGREAYIDGMPFSD